MKYHYNVQDSIQNHLTDALIDLYRYFPVLKSRLQNSISFMRSLTFCPYHPFHMCRP